MSFSAFPPIVAYGLLVAVALAIWLLYLIRGVRPHAAVPSLLLWQRVLARRRLPAARWRWLRSLLIALAIGLALALAVLRPEWAAVGAQHQRIVLVVDNASSMGARAGAALTRWQRAIADARSVVQAAPAGSEFLVLDTTGRAPRGGFVSAARALEQLEGLIVSPEPEGRVPPLPPAASMTRTYLFTDGVGIGPVPREMVVRSAFDVAANAGITAFEGRPVPGAPTRYEVFLRIETAGTVPLPVTLELTGTGGFRIERQLQVGADPVNLVLDVSAYAHGPLRAHVRAPGDALDLDDTAYWMVPPHGVRHVLVVTPGNEPLVDALRSLPDVDVTVHAQGDVAALPSADAYVFDRYAPADPPPAGALLFHPPRAAWIAARWNAASAVHVESWDDSHPLTAGVTWPELRLPQAVLAEAGAAPALVSARGERPAQRGGLVLAGRSRARWVAVGIDLADSNFPLLPGLSIFLGNVLDWLADRPAVIGAGLGRIEVPVTQAQVRAVSGGVIAATAAPQATLFTAARPGMFVAANAREQTIVVANVTDPRTVRINDSRLAAEQANVTRPAVAPWSLPEPWMALLAVALVLLALEWPAYLRRATE